MSLDRSPYAVLDELAGHPRGDDLARLVHTAAFAAADERRSGLSDGLTELADRAGLRPEDAETRFGNVLSALERAADEGAGSTPRLLLATLLARGVALSPPAGADAEGRVAETLVWLAAHTPVDALTALDAAAGERATGLWKAIAALIRRADSGRVEGGQGAARQAGLSPAIGRAEAILAAAALRSSTSTTARAEAAALSTEARDPIVRSILRDARAADAAPGDMPPGSRPTSTERSASAASADIQGELVPAPRGLVPLVLLAVTGLLLVWHLGRLVGRLLLQYRRPAEVRVTPRGLTVRTRTVLFGRTLKEGETHIPAEALRSVSREIRYPRLGIYAGLVSLGLGTYLGVSLFVDGARAGSPELLGVGSLFLAFGAAFDFGLSYLTEKARGRCRVIIVPRKGPVVALGGADPALADAALGRLVQA